MRVKVTRIEIWDVEHFDQDYTEKIDIHAAADSIQDDVLNSQDVDHETDDAKFRYTPKEIVMFKVERE